jgi:general secretion pathway protein J
MRDRSAVSGFTLIEALIATALMVAILAALATVTSQWLPNWNRGFARVQRTDLAAIGLERLVADLAAAEFVPPNNKVKGPLFDGAQLSVTFVRSALGPNSQPGLEIVRVGETADAHGLATVRERAPFQPLAPDMKLAQLKFTDLVVLMRAPYRISFSYAGSDRAWLDTWRDAKELPSAIRVTVRDAATSQILGMSTATMVHINVPAVCVLAKNPGDCAKPNADRPDGPTPATDTQTPATGKQL